MTAPNPLQRKARAYRHLTPPDEASAQEGGLHHGPRMLTADELDELASRRARSAVDRIVLAVCAWILVVVVCWAAS